LWLKPLIFVAQPYLGLTFATKKFKSQQACSDVSGQAFCPLEAVQTFLIWPKKVLLCPGISKFPVPLKILISG
jgi:hypothetical protein